MLGHPNQKQKLNKIKGFRRYFFKILKSAEVRKKIIFSIPARVWKNKSVLVVPVWLNVIF